MSELAIRRWDHGLGEWITVTVEASPEPRRAARRAVRRTGRPRDLAGLSATSPIPEAWRYTAYAPCDQLADTRSHIKTDTVKTHRTAVTAWGEFRLAESDRSECAATPLDGIDVAATARRVFTSVTRDR